MSQTLWIVSQTALQREPEDQILGRVSAFAIPLDLARNAMTALRETQRPRDVLGVPRAGLRLSFPVRMFRVNFAGDVAPSLRDGVRDGEAILLGVTDSPATMPEGIFSEGHPLYCYDAEAHLDLRGRWGRIDWWITFEKEGETWTTCQPRWADEDVEAADFPDTWLMEPSKASSQETRRIHTIVPHVGPGAKQLAFPLKEAWFDSDCPRDEWGWRLAYPRGFAREVVND